MIQNNFPIGFGTEAHSAALRQPKWSKVVSVFERLVVFSSIPRLRSCQEVERTPSAPSRLDLGVRLLREGEAPAEPRLRVDLSPGSRLSRSFALPAGLDQSQFQALTRHSGPLRPDHGGQVTRSFHRPLARYPTE